MHVHGKPSTSRYWLVLILSVSYMVAEIVGGIMSGSLALLADSAHMAIDTFAILLGLFAAWVSRLPATSEKTYGYYRAEILAAATNASSLILVSIWIFYQAWQRQATPHEIHGAMMTWVALGGLVVNVIGMFLMGHSTSDLNARGVRLHLLNDALGSVSAVVGGVMVWKFGMPSFDLWVSGFIALLILYGAWSLLGESVNVLLEGVPKGMRLNDIQQAMENAKGVLSVHDLHVWTVASGVNSLSAHICMNETCDATDLLNRLTQILKDRFHIEHVTMQLEPTDFHHESKTCNLSGHGHHH